MPLAIAIIILVSSLIYSYISTNNQSLLESKNYTLENYDKTTKTMNKNLNRTLPYALKTKGLPGNGRKIKVETVEGVLLRACKTIHTLSIAYNCPSPYREGRVWAFVGSPDTKGNLYGSTNTAWSGTKSPTFSCAANDMANFGRELVQDALPASELINYNIKYNFIGMVDDEKSDPCGYTGIVE